MKGPFQILSKKYIFFAIEMIRNVENFPIYPCDFSHALDNLGVL